VTTFLGKKSLNHKEKFSPPQSGLMCPLTFKREGPLLLNRREKGKKGLPKGLEKVWKNPPKKGGFWQ